MNSFKNWTLRLLSFFVILHLILAPAYFIHYGVSIALFFICLWLGETLRKRDLSPLINCLAWGLSRGALTALFLAFYMMGVFAYVFGT